MKKKTRAKTIINRLEKEVVISSKIVSRLVSEKPEGSDINHDLKVAKAKGKHEAFLFLLKITLRLFAKHGNQRKKQNGYPSHIPPVRTRQR